MQGVGNGNWNLIPRHIKVLYINDTNPEYIERVSDEYTREHQQEGVYKYTN